MAQGRAQSTQRQAERGRRARSDRARRERRFHGGKRGIIAERVDQIVVRDMDGSQSNRDRESTHARYKRVIDRFTSFLGEAKSKRDLSTLQASDVGRFRDREAKELSRSTANLSVKVLRICLGEAVRQGLLAVNPAVRVKLLKSSKESKRRSFTPAGNVVELAPPTLWSGGWEF